MIHHEPGGSVTRQWTMRIDGKIFRRLLTHDPRGSLHINRDSAGRSLGGAGRSQWLASAHITAPGRWYMRKVERENDITRYEESNYNAYGKRSN